MSGDLIGALDEVKPSRFQLRAALVSGMGFFTDAYDLFIIGTASALIKQDWHLSMGRLAVLNATMLGAACLGAICFGRIADVVGRKKVYWLVAAVMAVAAIGSALAPSFWVLTGFRFLLGRVLRRDRPGSGHDDGRPAPPGGVRDQLLLCRLRPEYDHVRAAGRALPGIGPGYGPRHLGAGIRGHPDASGASRAES